MFWLVIYHNTYIQILLYLLIVKVVQLLFRSIKYKV